VIRKYYGRSVVAVLLIPVVALLGFRLFIGIDPELARGSRNYVLHYTLLDHLRRGIWIASLLSVVALWLMAFLGQLRAKSRRRGWFWLALLGPPGFAALTALVDRSPLTPWDAYERQLSRLPKLLRVLYEVVLFAAFGWLSMQVIEWWDYGTALADAGRRGMALAEVLKERDASSGMWAFGDLMRSACLFVFLYALWPGACNVVAGLAKAYRWCAATPPRA